MLRCFSISQDLLLEDVISFHLKLCCLVTAAKFLLHTDVELG